MQGNKALKCAYINCKEDTDLIPLTFKDGAIICRHCRQHALEVREFLRSAFEYAEIHKRLIVERRITDIHMIAFFGEKSVGNRK